MSIELAWAAGFFDGEGCSSVGRNPKQRYYVIVCLNQRDRRALDRFHAAVAYRGAIYQRRGDLCFAWSASSNQAEDVMRMLWPYLGEVKREQYERAIADSGWSRRRASPARLVAAWAAETPVERE